jgi:mono/diheme cytochrome c family protein
LDERRVETRLWQKVESDYWVEATYAWDDDEGAATRHRGGDIKVGKATYHIPKSNECQDCHRGRTDRILGFEAVSLGLPDATGLTLERLNAEERLSEPLDVTELSIGDDGTELAAPVLGWMHANCGTTCHNRNSNSKGWSTEMFLRLDPEELDGRSLKRSDPLITTIGVAAVTPAFSGATRIVAGSPQESLLFELITHRESGRQMPPIASNLVDEDNTALVEEWIAALPSRSGGSADDDDEDVAQGGSGGSAADEDTDEEGAGGTGSRG